MAQVYRQLTHRIRIQRGPGRPDKVSERPRDDVTGRFLDSDEEPTLITFEEDDDVDIPWLLKIGAIVPWESAPEESELEEPNNGESE